MWPFLLISDVVSDLPDQLQIFWQFNPIELLGLLIGSGATRAAALEISKAFDRVWHAGAWCTLYSDILHDFSVTILRCYKDAYLNNFFLCTAKLWNSLSRECFPLIKPRINRHLLSVRCF